MDIRVARSINRLSARAVTSLTKPGLHADGGGLYLVVSPTGSRRWTFIFRFRGKRRELGLGAVNSVSLATAREAARAAREQVAAGIDPIEERRRHKATQYLQTFGAFADQFISDFSAQWKSGPHIRQWKVTFEVHAAALRPLHPSAITTDDVMGVLKPIWIAKPETARRIRERIERVLDAAKASGLRNGENPARWKGHLAFLLPRRPKLAQGHHAALPYVQMPTFMEKLQASNCVSARALEFTILTVGRTSEVRFAKLEEFNLDHATWVVPAERMKRKALHRVPLTKRALEIVQNRIAELKSGRLGHNGGPPLDAYLFPGASLDGVLSNMAMANLLPHLGYGDVTVHGFRSTFKDWASDMTIFPREFSEAALSHTVGDEVERAYRRGDAIDIRRQLMEAWEAYCYGKPATNVITMAPFSSWRVPPSEDSAHSEPVRRVQQS